MASGTGSPCGACKFLRRKCATDCIFAPYFCSEQGAARFAAIHKVFGASNVSKLLLLVPPADRSEAVVTIAYEAQARLLDPVYGCVAHIFALQQQVASLQLQLMQAKAQLAQSIMVSQSSRNQGQQGSPADPLLQPYSCVASTSPQSSLDCIDHSSDGVRQMQDFCFKEDFSTHACTKRRPAHNELGELQDLALRMIRN